MTLRAFALALFLAAPLAAQTAVTMHDNGDPRNRLDLVITGDGYTASEMGKFASDAGNLVAAILKEEPFHEYQRYINVRRVEVASAESGADHPEHNVFRSTAFDAAYNCGGIQRLVCVNTGKVRNAVAFLPAEQRDYILVVVNDSEYGGSGGSVSVTSTNVQAVEILLHEFGHTFGGLADEYDSQPPTCYASVEPAAPNVTRATSRDLIKWAAWIEQDTPVPTFMTMPSVPGLYKGAAYCPETLYRPTYMSKMRVLGRPYDQVNTEQLILNLYDYTSPIDAYSPAAAQQTIARGGSASFSVAPPEPVNHALDVRWRVDGTVRTHGRDFVLTTAALPAGNHTVTAEAADATPLVRRDLTQALVDQVTWTVTVLPGAPATLLCRVTASGTGLGGVTLTLGGLSKAVGTTDTSGAYVFPGLESGGAYTLTPSKPGYQFVPARLSVPSLNPGSSVQYVAVPTGPREPARGVPCVAGGPCRVR